MSKDKKKCQPVGKKKSVEQKKPDIQVSKKIDQKSDCCCSMQE